MNVFHLLVGEWARTQWQGHDLGLGAAAGCQLARLRVLLLLVSPEEVQEGMMGHHIIMYRMEGMELMMMQTWRPMMTGTQSRACTPARTDTWQHN